MRVVVGWVGAVIVMAAAIVGGVAIANATAFSASAFARDYLVSLSIGHIDEVRALPGVTTTGLDERMLRAEARDDIRWEITGETVTDGVHHVTVEFGPTDGVAHTTQAELAIERVGSRFAVFPRWGFARSPVTALDVTAHADPHFTVGRVPIDLGAERTGRFATFIPGAYTFGLDSEFLHAVPKTVLTTSTAASVDIETHPTDAFLTAAAEALDKELGTCTSQQVLFPTGCPFGHAISNRVASPPEWSITTPPTLHLDPVGPVGGWLLTADDGVATLRVSVQSLFDGSVSELAEEVPFSVSYRAGFDGSTLVLAPASDDSESSG